MCDKMRVDIKGELEFRIPEPILIPYMSVPINLNCHPSLLYNKASNDLRNVIFEMNEMNYPC